MHIVFLALGANVGNKEQNIEQAVSLLQEKITGTERAPLYKTKPMYFSDQDYFLNTALKGYTNMSPEDLLLFVKGIEKRVGRKKRFPNGPREIDIDIIFYDDLTCSTDTLVIPHPKVSERDFVLKPLRDLSPDFIHPVLKKSVTKLFQEIPQKNYTVF